MIRNILVPTDFSSNARQAAVCAAYLAQQAKARLMLLHVLPMVYMEEEEAVEEKAQRLLDAAANDLFMVRQISITRLLKPGIVTQEIPLIAERLKADVVLMGARGLSDDATKEKGSVATELLRSNDFPLICCPAEASLPFRNEILWPLLANDQLCNHRGLNLLQRFMAGAASKKST